MNEVIHIVVPAWVFIGLFLMMVINLVLDIVLIRLRKRTVHERQ